MLFGRINRNISNILGQLLEKTSLMDKYLSIRLVPILRKILFTLHHAHRLRVCSRLHPQQIHTRRTAQFHPHRRR